mgnify:CR=1 FL=1
MITSTVAILFAVGYLLATVWLCRGIRLTAREAPEELGYNVTRIGRNTKIPRIGFIRFLEGGAGYENRV